MKIPLRFLAVAATLGLALTLALPAGARADGGDGKAPAGPQIAISPSEVLAGPDLSWNMHLHVANSMGVGLYVDSVTCRMENRDPGETGASRITEVLVPTSFGEPVSVTAGESFEYDYVRPSAFETGTLSFHLYGHRSDRTPVTAAGEVDVKPGPVSAEHPSEFAMVDGKKVECVLFRPAAGGPSPGLLLVHDHGTNARGLLGQAMPLAMRGYTVMLVSLPGYGLSEGPADLGGPHTIAALGAALDRLKRTPGVDPAHLAAWGMARGAGPVASLATGRTDLAAVVLQSGVYDLWATSRATTPDFHETILREAGRDSSGWRTRSPLLRAASVKAAALVLHRESDNEVPAVPAHAFAAAIQTAGGTVESKFFPGTGHALSRPEVSRAVMAFLAARLGK